MVRLGDICEVVSGTTPKSNIPEYWDGELNWVTPAELDEDSYVIYESQRKITEQAVKDSSLKPFPAGTVLLSSRAPIGKVAIAGVEMYCNQGFKNLVCSEKVHNKYLFWFLKDRTEFLNSLGRGATFKEISKSIVENIEIPLPDIEKQKRIASVLDQLSEISSLRKQQLAKLDELVKARFVEMFGDPVRNERNWEQKKLVDICTKLTDGTHFSPESFATGDYKYITAKNIKKDGFDFSNISYVSESVHNEIYSRCNPEYGDVLYIKDGVTTGIAMVNTLHEQFTLLSSVALLKQNRSIVLGDYLCSVLNNSAMYKSIRENMGGAAITRLTIKKLNDILIPIAPIKQQQEYANFCSQINQQKLTIRQSLDKLELLKKSLMQEYFG